MPTARDYYDAVATIDLLCQSMSGSGFDKDHLKRARNILEAKRKEAYLSEYITKHLRELPFWEQLPEAARQDIHSFFMPKAYAYLNPENLP